MKTSKTNKRVWLASYYDSSTGVTTRAFSTKAKALAWKAGCEADGAFDEDKGQSPFFSIAPVRIDSADYINEG